MSENTTSDGAQYCVHCGVEIRMIRYALGDRIMHSRYPYNVRDAYEFCRLTVATEAVAR